MTPPGPDPGSDPGTGPVVCYGASGYTGRLAAKALADRGADVVLAGRSRARLEAVRDDPDLGLAEADAVVEVRAASARDVGALRALLLSTGASAVVNTAGPFLRVGDGVARACVAAGVPYVDSTGEQVFARGLADALHEVARDAGVPLVPMLAFEYAPGDLLAALLLDGRPAERLDVVYKVDHGVASAGTAKSILEVAARTGHQRRGGRLVEEAPAEETRTVELEVDDGRLRERSAYTFPGGEVLTVPRHQAVDDVRTFMVAHPRTIARLSRWGPVARTLLKGPLLALAEALVDLRHEDPASEERSSTRGRVLLEATLDDGAVERSAFDCRDPYALTAHLLAEGAVRLARGETGEGGAPGGVLAPAEVFPSRPFLEAVRKHHPPVAWGPEALPEAAPDGAGDAEDRPEEE